MKKIFIHQERRAIILFLIFFYLTDLFDYWLNYNIVPLFAKQAEVSTSAHNCGIQLFIELALIPAAILLINKNKPGYVKYLYFYSFTLINLMSEAITFWGKPGTYYTGNLLEILLVLISPIFINRKFFFIVSIGTIIKYAIVGMLIQAPQVLVPIAFVVLFSIVSFVLLNRFQDYVSAIDKSHNARLDGIVKGIVSMVELKDVYTRGHSERVAGYAQLLASSMNRFSREELKTFHYACLLHDIGKINIPDHILIKPGKLTNEEYEIIKTHTVTGSTAARGIDGLENCIEVIRHHHERWDGGGYPDHLKGTDIPIFARIAAIADAFDAMTSSRSYRSALSADVAFNRILEGKGTQFDPDLVDVLQEIIPSWLKLHDNCEKATLNTPIADTTLTLERG